jgi:hypothetical protein
MLSKLTSSRWSRCSKLDIRKGAKILHLTSQLERVRRIPRIVHVFLELALDV